MTSDQLRKLSAEATEGPWRIRNEDGDVAIVSKTGPGWVDYITGRVNQGSRDAALIVLLVNNRDNIAALIDAAQKVTDLYVRSELDMETIGAIEEMDVVLAAFGAGQETGG